MSEFQIKKASRQGVKALVGFYGKSGSGKTMSALLFARGLAGPNGRITLIDSESGRGSIFADLIPGGYNVLELASPFSPDRYLAAFEAAEANSDVVVVDSMSHEWSGEGGVLDMQEVELDRMAGNDWKKRESCKMAAWIKPKSIHKKFIQRLLRSRVALICCLRGEEKTHIVKEGATQYRLPGEEDPLLYPPRSKGGKSKVVTDDFSTPLFDPRFIFEMLLNFETVARDGQGGFVIPRKITHPSIGALLPSANQQIGEAHGAALAAWCASAGSPKPSPKATTSPDPKSFKSKLWAMTSSKHGGDPNALQQWLIDETILADDQTLSELTAPELERLIELVDKKLKG